MKLFGIKISIHWSWWIFALSLVFMDLISLNYSGVVWNSYIATTMLGLVVGHELAHALTARKYGYETTGIIMHFLGGVAMINASKMKPEEEFWIALAGPMFNIALAIAAGILIVFNPTGMIGLRGEDGLFAPSLLGNCVIYFTMINLLMGLFNLIPAYPLDGGRILRSLMSGLKPTIALNISNGLSLFFAGVFLVIGFSGFNPFFIFLGGILIFLVWAERNKPKH